MPKVKVNGMTMNYDQQGAGEPLILIPYLAADHACYAFQVAEYAKHFTCISVDPRGAGETDKPEGVYSTELFAEDVSGFMKALGVERGPVKDVPLDCGSRLTIRGNSVRRTFHELREIVHHFPLNLNNKTLVREPTGPTFFVRGDSRTRQ
jgi:pimeloyl-ACP methyl ester carboxylesterase